MEENCGCYSNTKELLNVEYKAKGSTQFALKTLELLEGIAKADNSWGLDHGTWSILNVMYPNADIPVYQLSIDMNATPKELFEIGTRLKSLRESNVLVLGSGNIVHNLGTMNYSLQDGYDWAYEFNDFMVENIEERNYESIFNYQDLGDSARLAVPTTEHLSPLFYILGATNNTDQVLIYNRNYVAGCYDILSF